MNLTVCMKCVFGDHDHCDGNCACVVCATRRQNIKDKEDDKIKPREENP